MAAAANSQNLNRQSLQAAIPGSTTKKTSKIPFANAYVEDCYKFIVVPGNNSGLVRKAIERREWWIEIPPVHSMYNFKWQPVSYGIKFDRLGPVRSKPGGEWGSSGNTANNNGGSGNAPGPSDDGVGPGNAIDIKQMVNHLEFHHIISEKAALFNEVQKYCDGVKENVFDVCVPITFYVEVTDLDKPQVYNQTLQPFLQFYSALEENRERVLFIK